MKYIIMCGGPRVVKQEIPNPLRSIFGQTLIERTIALLRRYHVTDIAISSDTDKFDHLGVPVLHHDNYVRRRRKKYHWVNAFYKTKDPVCYLMGDVFYSRYAIATIVGTKTDDIEFFASAAPFAGHYTKHHAEPFALKVQDIDRFWKCVEKTKRLESAGKFRREALAWELWQVIKGTPLNEIKTNYTVINDYTVDLHDDDEQRALERELRFICNI